MEVNTNKLLFSNKNGIKINDVFSIVKKFKRTIKDKPIILMGYYNMIYQFDENKFINKCKKSKVDGLIVVDLPYPENKNFSFKCKKKKYKFYSTYFTNNL